MRGKEAEPLLLEEGRHVLEEEEPEEGRRVGGGDEVGDSKPTAGGASSGSASAANDSSGIAATTSGGQLEGEAEEAAHPVATAPGPERPGEDVEVATPLVVSSSLHFECARQLPLWLVLVETALDVLQFVQTELELGIWSVLVFRHGLLAVLNLLMAVKDCFDEVKEEVQYQYETKCRKVERKELSTGLQAKILVPVLVRLRLFPKEAAPSGTWWNQKLQHAARVIAVVQAEVRLNLVILLVGCASPLYSVAKAALSGNFDRLAQVTAVNALQIIVFNLYKAHEKRQQMWQLEQKVQELRKDRTLNWEAREKLQELQGDDRLSLSDKVRHFHELVVEYPEYFFNDSHWRESEARYIDIYSVPSDPARTGARGGVPALEDVSKLLGLKLDGCKTAGEEEAFATLLVQGEAGAGKSTLAKLVALRATKDSLEVERHPESCVTGVTASVAPLVVYLHCAQHQRDGSSRLSVRSYLEALLVGDASQVSDKDWSSFLEETPIVLVLDAYDEADSRFTLREVLERDGLNNARSLRIVATARSGTFETDDQAKEAFSCEINGRRVSPTMRWLRPIGDEEQRSSALAPLEATDDLWQTLHWKHPGLAFVATTPLMAALVAQAHKERALENLGPENCEGGVETKDGGDKDVEATLGSRIYKNRVRRRAHLISWHLKRQVEVGMRSLQTYADIDLSLHKLLFSVGSSNEVWMTAGQLVARKLASLMWIQQTSVLRVLAPKAPGSDGCLTSLLASLCTCCSGASADGSYSPVDTEVAVTARGSAEQVDENDDIGRQLRSCLCTALPVELQACMEEVDMHVMLLYLLGFCCSLKFIRTEDTGTCEVAFIHDSFRACRLAEAMASYQDNEEAASRLWACRLLLVGVHKDLITLLADITRSSQPFQNFLWRCIDESKLQGKPRQLGNLACYMSHKWQDKEKPKSVAAANAATVLTCAHVSFSGRDLTGAQLQGAYLRGAVCHGTNFDGANLQSAELSHIFASASSFRGAELQNARYGELASLQGHIRPGTVHCVVFSPDGKTIASGSTDCTIRVWDAVSGAHLLTLEGHESWVMCVDCSPDGSTIASCSKDKTVRLWDVATGSHIRTLEGHSAEVRGLSYSPDGATIASASLDDTIRLWNAASGDVVQTLKLELEKVALTALKQDLGSEFTNSLHITYNADGDALASTSGIDIVLWDVPSRSRKLTLRGHRAMVCCISYSPDGKAIASGSKDKTIRVWDAAAGCLLRSLEGHVGQVLSIAYSPDGSIIASGGGEEDQTIRLVNATSGSHVLTLAGHCNYVSTVAYSPDGRTIATSGGDTTIRLWEAVSGPPPLQREGHSQGVHAVSFRPDGTTIASGGFDETLRLWDAESGCHMMTLEGGRHGHRFSFSPDGQAIASSSRPAKGIHLWDALSGAGQWLTLEPVLDEQVIVKHVAYSPDGRTLATWSTSHEIKLWDAVTCLHKTTLKTCAEVLSVAFSPDCRTIAAGCEYCNGIPQWDVESGCPRLTLEGHTDFVLSVAFSPESHPPRALDNSSTCRLASGSLDHTIRVWDVATGSHVLTLEGHSDAVRCVAFSPDGGAIASSSNDTTIMLWDAATGVHRLTLEGHIGWVECVAFSADGRTIASASFDRSIQVWQRSSSKHSSWEAGEGAPRPPCTRLHAAGANCEASYCWLLQRKIQSTEPVLWASGADFRGALGLGANAKLMLQQKGAKVD